MISIANGRRLHKLTQQIFWILSVCLVCLVQSLPLRAEPYTPKADDEVIARWKVQETMQADADLQQISDYIDQGQYPGEADYRYGRAKAWLEKAMDNTRPDAETFYLYARVLQHQHQFEQALRALDSALLLKPNDINSLLLQANIYSVQGEYARAKQSCLGLLGQADILLLSTCALEVASQDGQLETSYQALNRLYQAPAQDSSRLASSTAMTQTTPEKVDDWITQILADMALRLSDVEAAAQHLQYVDLDRAPVSLLALWADIQLAANQPEQVLSQLEPIVTRHAIQDDTLLLRLAIAENALANAANGANAIHATTRLPWRTQFAQRVALRELRQDSLHAADLAKYYLLLDVNPSKALYWAKMNWQVARQAADKALLEQAQQTQ